LHAFVTALENANLLSTLEGQLQNSTSLPTAKSEHLQNVLRSGSLLAGELAGSLDVANAAARS
jgi:hypothetical protein